MNNNKIKINYDNVYNTPTKFQEDITSMIETQYEQHMEATYFFCSKTYKVLV